MTILLTHRRDVLPSRFAGLAVWLDAADLGSITRDGSDIVSQWNNKGNAGAGNATQSTTANKPKFVASAINGRPAIQGRHDGSNASMLSIANSAALDYTAFEAFAVCQRVTDSGAEEAIYAKWDAGASQSEMFGAITSTDFPRQYTNSNGGAGTASATWGSTLATGTPIILNGSFTPGSPGSTSVRVNNGTAVTATTINSIFNGTAAFTLFARLSSSAILTTSAFRGYIGELLFFTRALAASERALIVTYLSRKWGIAL